MSIILILGFRIAIFKARRPLLINILAQINLYYLSIILSMTKLNRVRQIRYNCKYIKYKCYAKINENIYRLKAKQERR